MSDFFDDDEFSLVPSRRNQPNPMEVVIKSTTPTSVSESMTNIANDLAKFGKLTPQKCKETIKTFESCYKIGEDYYTQRYNSANQTLQAMMNAQVQIQGFKADVEKERIKAEKEVVLAEKVLKKYKMDHDVRMKILEDNNKGFEEKIKEIKLLIEDTLKNTETIRNEIVKDKKKKFYEINIKTLTDIEKNKSNIIERINELNVYMPVVPALPESK